MTTKHDLWKIYSRATTRLSVQQKISSCPLKLNLVLRTHRLLTWYVFWRMIFSKPKLLVTLKECDITANQICHHGSIWVEFACLCFSKLYNLPSSTFCVISIFSEKSGRRANFWMWNPSFIVLSFYFFYTNYKTTEDSYLFSKIKSKNTISFVLSKT